MRSSNEIMGQLLGTKLPTKEHSAICKCNMCMKSKISEEKKSDHMTQLQSTMVDRRNPDNPIRPLMKATEAHDIIQAGTNVNMMEATGIQKSDIPSGYDIEQTQPKELIIHAKWKHRTEETATSGKDASVFGGLGVLLVPPQFSVLDIPKMNALAAPQAFLDKYGAQLIPLDQPVSLDAVEDESVKTLYLVQYDFDKEYIDEYVMKMTGGGGLFVETHPFPHVFTPLSKDCGGALILGVKQDNDTFSFTAFTIPFGFTMKIASNVIHGDSFFVGPYAIALTDTELADSVIFRQETSSRDIQKVTQTLSPTIKLSILAEYRVAQAVNNHLMIEKIVQEGPQGKTIAFFQTLPTIVLMNVRNISTQSNQAYTERLSLIDEYERVQEITDEEMLEDSASIGDITDTELLSEDDSDIPFEDSSDDEEDKTSKTHRKSS